MVVEILSFMLKGQTRACSGCSMQFISGIRWWGHCSLVQKGQNSGCSVQWTQWNSDIWWWGHCLSCKKVKPEDAVDAVCSGLVVYGGGDIVFDAKRSNQWIQWMQSHSGHSTQCTQWTQYPVDAVE